MIKNRISLKDCKILCKRSTPRLLTPNEGINQKHLKFWADVEDKYGLVVTKNLGVGVDFPPCSEGDFFTGRP